MAITGCQSNNPKTAAIGAACPWISYPAATAKTTGTVRGPSHAYLTPEAEAIGGKLVKLDADGQFLEITSRQRANTIVVRYCIPDAPAGGGTNATLGLYINGKFETKLRLTSRYSWIYGDFPWSNGPQQGKPHHFFDESHALIRNVAPGDVIRLQKDHDDTAAYCLIDLIELEKINPPLPRPVDSLSIADFGVAPNDGKDASAALMRCMQAAQAQGKSVWIPEGEFYLNGSRIKVGNVRVQGAGMWHSKLTGTSPMFELTGAPVEFSNLAIFGNIDRRVDELPENAFDGNFGNGSVFKNLWIEHVKCGFWTKHGTENMRVQSCRIRNTMADGLNFCDGTSFSVVDQCHLRNTGDDALATWSPNGSWSSQQPCVQNEFVNNTIEMPWLANGIAVYGGTGHLVAHNKITGGVFSNSGILISSGFESIPFAGTIRIEDNSITDTGGDCYIGETVGGLWIHAKDSDITAPIEISGLRITDSRKSGITIHGPRKALNINFRNIEINGTEEYGIEVKPSAGGSLHANGLKIANNRLEAIHNRNNGQFSVGIED